MQRIIACSRMLCCCVLLLWSAQSFAESSPEKLERAVQLVDQLKLSQALKLLNKLVRDPDLNQTQRAKAFLYRGFCFFYLKGPRPASLMLRIALKLNPKSEIPKQTPPPLRALFDKEYKQLFPTPPPRRRPILRPPPRRRPILRPPPPKEEFVRLNLSANTPLYPGKDIQFQGQCAPHPKDARLQIFIRKQGDQSYRRFPLQWNDEQCKGTITNPYPATHKEKGRVEFVVEARDPKGTLIAQSHPLHHPAHIPLTLKNNPNAWILPVVLVVTALSAGATVAAILWLRPKRTNVNVHVNLNPQPLLLSTPPLPTGTTP